MSTHQTSAAYRASSQDSVDQASQGRDTGKQESAKQDPAKQNSAARDAETHDLENVLEELSDTIADSDDKPSVGDVIDAFAERSFGALVTLISLVAAMPVIGAIPGVSILTGSLIILVAGQYLIGRDTPWVPERLRNICIEAETMNGAIEKVRPYAASVDRWIQPRLSALISGRAARIAVALACVMLALLYYPAAVVPWGVMVPALSTLALGLALVGRDGLLALIGLIGAACSVALLVYLI